MEASRLVPVMERLRSQPLDLDSDANHVGLGIERPHHLRLPAYELAHRVLVVETKNSLTCRENQFASNVFDIWRAGAPTPHLMNLHFSISSCDRVSE